MASAAPLTGSSSAEHTFDSTCRLEPIHHDNNIDGVPPIDARFFYSSLIPIDDPHLAGSSSTASDARSSKNQFRPFSHGDNNALERAWLSLTSEADRRDHESARKKRRQSDEARRTTEEKRELLIQALARKHTEAHGSLFRAHDVSISAPKAAPNNFGAACCPELVLDVAEELNKTFCALVGRLDSSLDPDNIIQDIILTMEQSHKTARDADKAQKFPNLATSSPRSIPTPISRVGLADADITESQGEGAADRNLNMAARRRAGSDLASNGRSRSGSQRTNPSFTTQTPTPVGSIPSAKPPTNDDGISGKPFVRVESDGIRAKPQYGPSNLLAKDSPGPGTPTSLKAEHIATFEDTGMDEVSQAVKESKYGRDSADVAVGVSRLHMVTLPALQMKPIYWSPVNDIAAVMRATWFYRDTMLPVPPAAANQLEAGYHELRPWSETWMDEIRCAIEVGPLGEEKVSHRLWPKEADISHGDGRRLWEPLISSDPFCAARCFSGDAAAEGVIEPAAKKDAADPPHRIFSNYHVVYKDAKEAFLLKPSLKPSAYYGRKPVWKISKGVTVGIPVVRGFDQGAWDHLHHKKQKSDKPAATQSPDFHHANGGGGCQACKTDKDRGQVTDLVLVAHGIGQKFAERVESYHFTHAMNAFRRAVSMEMRNPTVKAVLREGQSGLMILPLNWRMGLSFEDGGPMQEEDRRKYNTESFGLKDIEPDTIPAIRSMISDVMFDIPFYMSHHKGKMIQALVSEANRVYRLWCRNNPGFVDRGRVHLIGHSLGSAMALDVLSRQPTRVPEIDLSPSVEPASRFFEFDTTNIFLVGSPAGFFLLLERGALVPRRGRSKPGADEADTLADDVVADVGVHGCLAVDNIYNILAKEDPIAYLLGGAIDSAYAASLKKAFVPSTATSFMKSVGDVVRNAVPGLSGGTPPLAPAVNGADTSSSPSESSLRPPAGRLPSQLELEVHDFSREEVAEKKAFLLNDNGQVDWFLRSGGGPLEIQYLNMLSAHSSYWANRDFIRMLCLEIGRRPGRAHTLPAMRAVKAGKRILPGA